MKKFLALLVLTILPLFASAGEYGQLRVQVVDKLNPEHNTPVNLKINGHSVLSFPHNLTAPKTIDIKGNDLARGQSTPMSSDYGNLQSDCHFQFQLLFSFDGTTWINLGTWNAPSTSVQANLPIGLCDGDALCSTDPQIQRRLKEIEDARWAKAKEEAQKIFEAAFERDRQAYEKLQEKLDSEKRLLEQESNVDKKIDEMSADMAEQKLPELPPETSTASSWQTLDEQISWAINNGTVDELIQKNAFEQQFLQTCLAGDSHSQYLCNKYGGLGWIGGAAEAISVALAINPKQAVLELQNRILDSGARDSLKSELEIRGELRDRIQQVVDLKRSEAMWSKVAAATRLGIGFSPLNDVVDFCELATGRSMCLPSGQALRAAERFMAGLGVIAGNRMIWESLSSEARVALLGDKSAVEAADAARNFVRHGPINPGSLHEIQLGKKTIADTFRGGSYFTYETGQVVTLYRVQASSISAGDKIGLFWSRSRPEGPLQAIIDSGLDPKWGNKGTHWAEIRVPEGVVLHEGIAGAQGGLVGGGNQVVVEKVDFSWIIDQGVF